MHKAMQLDHPAPLSTRPLAWRDVATPAPGPGELLIRVAACGVCRSNLHMIVGDWAGAGLPAISPIVPGHEVTGTVAEVGPDVEGFAPGDRVGVQPLWWTCEECEYCTSGREQYCLRRRITGEMVDGGYAEYMIAPASALALIPQGLSAVDAGPLMCAGVTTYNSLRNSGARPGDLVAVLGIGGLGHLGIQFAAKMGFRTVAIARGSDKEPLSKKLGASIYINSQAQDAAAELVKLGGARVILATVTSGKAMSAVLGGLGVNGKLMVLGAADAPLEVDAGLMIGGRRSIMGWPSGNSIDSQDTLSFSAQSGVRAMTEVFPLERAAEAYEHMMSGKARFRAVLTTGH